jgi:hypothetical protein
METIHKITLRIHVIGLAVIAAWICWFFILEFAKMGDIILVRSFFSSNLIRP